jgi:hypothetical protein
MMKEMLSAQGLDRDDFWNDGRDVKSSYGYVIIFGNRYGFRNGYEEYDSIK